MDLMMDLVGVRLQNGDTTMEVLILEDTYTTTLELTDMIIPLTTWLSGIRCRTTREIQMDTDIIDGEQRTAAHQTDTSYLITGLF